MLQEETFDVVVVGGGGAGLAAAIEAAESGAAMAFSSVSVVTNSLRLRGARLGAA